MPEQLQVPMAHDQPVLLTLVPMMWEAVVRDVQLQSQISPALHSLFA